MQCIRVLIADDEIEFLETLKRRLKKRGLEVEGVKSGEEALDLLSKQEFDVLILDVKMPGLDGIETLRLVKEKAPDMEVIMLTGHANVEVAMQGMEIGAFDYLMKPMDIDELVYKVEDAYKKKELYRKKKR